MNLPLLVLPASYLCGAIPFGWVVARAKGLDIRKHGSGNIGATNVFRVMGKGWGTLVFLLDFLKGLAPVLVMKQVVAGSAVEAQTGWTLGAGALAIVGHTASVFLRFKGGKGVATSAGVLAGVAPLALLPALGVWILTFALTRIVSLGSILAALTVGICGWIFHPTPRILPSLLTALAALVIWKHRSNISRLLRGEENSFRRKAPPAPPA